MPKIVTIELIWDERKGKCYLRNNTTDEITSKRNTVFFKKKVDIW